MLQEAVLGGGCFWCTQSIFQRLKGVEKVESGFAGGHLPHPTYSQVRSGTTGHAQVIRILYNPELISYHTLVGIFLHIHDPTSLNKQGMDTGPQYRSLILYRNQSQLQTIHQVFASTTKEGTYQGFPQKIVTEIKDLNKFQFFPADQGHQNYYNSHPEEEESRMVIKPKLQRFYERYAEFIDDEKM